MCLVCKSRGLVACQRGVDQGRCERDVGAHSAERIVIRGQGALVGEGDPRPVRVFDACLRQDHEIHEAQRVQHTILAKQRGVEAQSGDLSSVWEGRTEVVESA